jgi:hypothetical protein
MYAGLGSNTSSRPQRDEYDQRQEGREEGGGGNDEDMYSQYRRNRSGAYHDFLAKSIAASMQGAGR